MLQPSDGYPIYLSKPLVTQNYSSLSFLKVSFKTESRVKSMEEKVLEENTSKYGQWRVTGRWAYKWFLFSSFCLFALSTCSTVAITLLILQQKKKKSYLVTILTLSPQGGSEDQTGDTKETGPHRGLWFHCPPRSPCPGSELVTPFSVPPFTCLCRSPSTDLMLPSLRLFTHPSPLVAWEVTVQKPPLLAIITWSGLVLESLPSECLLN